MLPTYFIYEFSRSIVVMNTGVTNSSTKSYKGQGVGVGVGEHMAYLGTLS